MDDADADADADDAANFIRANGDVLRGSDVVGDAEDADDADEDAGAVSVSGSVTVIAARGLTKEVTPGIPWLLAEEDTDDGLATDDGAAAAAAAPSVVMSIGFTDFFIAAAAAGASLSSVLLLLLLLLPASLTTTKPDSFNRLNVPDIDLLCAAPDDFATGAAAALVAVDIALTAEGRGGSAPLNDEAAAAAAADDDDDNAESGSFLSALAAAAEALSLRFKPANAMALDRFLFGAAVDTTDTVDDGDDDGTDADAFVTEEMHVSDAACDAVVVLTVTGTAVAAAPTTAGLCTSAAATPPLETADDADPE